MSWETATTEEIRADFRRVLDAYANAALWAEQQENERLLRRALGLSSWTFWKRIHMVETQHEPLGPWFVGVASHWDPPASSRSWTDPDRRDVRTPRPSRTRSGSHRLRWPRDRRGR